MKKTISIDKRASFKIVHLYSEVNNALVRKNELIQIGGITKR